MSWVGPRIDVTADDHLSYAVVRSMGRGVSYVTYVFKATFEIVPGGAARVVAPEAVILFDQHRSADPRSSLAAASEAMPFLSGAAVLMTGTAHLVESSASAGEHSANPAPFAVRLAVIASSGPLVDKHVRIQPRGAEPTPLAYEEALATHDNPAGSRWPRIVQPNRLGDVAGFGPIAASWPSRVELLRGASAPELRDGMIDCGPGLDARFFNPAPSDQQTPFLAGTETIVIEGVDPELPRLATHLGGVGLTVTQRPDEGASLEPRLDMLIIDTDRRRISLVWRVFSEPPRNVQEIAIRAVFRSSRLIAETPAASPPPQVAKNGKHFTTVDLPMRPDGRGSPLPFANPHSEPVAEVKAKVVSTKRVEVDPEAKRRLERTLPTTAPLPLGSPIPFPQSAMAKERSTEPLIPATPYDPSFEPPSVKRVPRGLIVTKQLTTAQQEKLSQLLSARQAAEPDVVAVDASLSAEPTVVTADPAPNDDHGSALEVSSRPKIEPPDDDRGDARRASLLLRLRENGAPRDMDLNGADLSDLDLTGLSFSGSKLDGADLSRCVLREANLAGVSLKRARLVKAMLDGADLTGAILTGSVLDEASLAGARLTRADLSAATAKGASFVGAQAERAKLTSAVLEGALFTGANLLESDWTKARASGADFTNATLEGATLVQLSAERAIFTGANLARADAERALLSEANLQDITASKANFEQACLDRACLDRAHIAGGRFSKASLDEASFVEADLTGADFSKCVAPSSKLNHAVLEQTNLKQANFSGASFSNAKLARANLGRGNFATASFDGADLTGTDAREARLGGANLTHANLTGADFRDADLSGTQMVDTILVDAKLKGARR